MFKDIRENDLKKEGERRLLEAKILDQYQFATTKNKIKHNNFLNSLEKKKN